MWGGDGRVGEGLGEGCPEGCMEGRGRVGHGGAWHEIGDR